MNVLLYSVFPCFPSQGLDSVIFFEFEKPLCSYVFKSEEGGASVQLAAFLCEVNRTTISRIPRPVAEDMLLKHDALQAYQKAKTLISHLLRASEDNGLQLAYRAARKNYISAVNNFTRSGPCSDDFEKLHQAKTEANAIFKVVRRVYEQKHMLDECLPRCFDGLPEETINSMYNQECKGE